MSDLKQKIQPIKGINLDDDETKLSPEEARFLKGIEVFINKSGSDSPQGGNAGVFTEQLSNTMTIPDVTTLLPQTGYNQTIGSFYYPTLNYYLWYVFNSSLSHCIILYDAASDTYTNIATRQDFKFDVTKRIRASDIVVVNDVDVPKVLLYFIDANNEPRKINITTAINTSGYTTPFYATKLPHSETEEYIKAIKYPPYLRPQISSTEKDVSVKYNYVVNKMFQWRYRFVYDDGEKSVLSPISTLGYIAQDPCNNSSSVTTSDNFFILEMYAGSAIVRRIEILFRYNNGDETNLDNPTDWYLYDTIDKYDINDVVILENYDLNIQIPNSFTYSFYNNKEYQLFDISESNRIYDELPEVAGAQELTDNNALIYGDCKEGKDNLTELNIGTEADPFITIGASFPDNDSIDTMTVKGYLVVHTADRIGFTGHNQPVWSKGVQPFVFGGLDTSYGNNVILGLQAEFGQNAISNGSLEAGFVVQLRGTSFTATTKQFLYKSGSFVSAPAFALLGTNPSNRETVINNVEISKYTFVQYFEFVNIPVGRYTLSVLSHLQAEIDTLGQNSSTYLLGCAKYADYLANPLAITRIFPQQRDFVINGCECVVDGVVDFNDCITGLPSGGDANKKGFPVIWDIAFVPSGIPESMTVLSKNFAGYFLEAYSPGYPIELAKITTVDNSVYAVPPPVPQSTVFGSETTDHNGFYFVAMCAQPIYDNVLPTPPDKIEIVLEFSVIDNTVLQVLANQQLVFENNAGVDGTVRANIAIDPAENVNGGGLTGIDCYAICNHYDITGQIINIANGNGAGGVPIVLSRGRYTTTDAQGNFTLSKVHADSSIRNGDREDYLILSQGFCVVLDEDDSQCIAYEDKAGTPVIYPAYNYDEVAPSNIDCSAPITGEIAYAQRDVTVLFSDRKGLKAGGFYLTGIIWYDYALRPTFVQAPKWMEIYIKSTPERFGTGKDLMPPNVFATIFPSFNLPAEAKYMAFARTKDLFISNYLQWLVNSVTYINADGVTVAASSATSIKINISNLNTFNATYKYSTNTIYDYVKGDRVLFLQNGNGDYYDGVTSDLVDIEMNGDTENTTVDLVIPNDLTLTTLIAGAWIQLYTPRKRESAELFFEISNLYPCRNDSVTQPGVNVPCVVEYDNLIDKNAVVNSLNSINSGVVDLNTWDTYWHTRNIFVAGVTVYRFIPYEHHSYNDLWNSRAEDIGRTNIINRDAKQIQRTNLMRWSRIFDTDTFTNGLCSFDSANNRATFKQYGAIRLLYSVRDILFVFQELSVFKCAINKEVLRTADGGNLVSDSSNFISKPNAVTGQFGLQDPATFQDFDGMFVWLDVINSAIVFCDGNRSVDASIILKIKSYLVDKCTFLYKNNIQSADLVYTHSTRNPKTNDYILSFFKSVDHTTAGDISEFVNQEKEIVITKNETIIINPYTKSLKTFTGYTPEYLGVVDRGLEGSYFVSFFRGKAFIHNNDTITDVNTFYGEKTDTIVDIVCNQEEGLVKVFSNMAIESNDIPWFSDKVTTSKKDQLSIIPIELMIRKEGIYYTEFKQDINSDGGLIDGDAMRGVYCRVRLIRSQDLLYKDKYSELNNIVIYFQKSMLSNK